MWKRALVAVGVLLVGCRPDGQCIDDNHIVVSDVFDEAEAGEDSITMKRDSDGIVTLRVLERGNAVEARFPTDAEVDDAVGVFQLTTGTNVIGEGTETAYFTVIDERGLLFTGGFHPAFDRAQGGGYSADSPFSLGDATGIHCNSADAYGVRVRLDDGVSDLGAAAIAGTLNGMPVHVQAAGGWKSSFVASEAVLDGYGPGAHTQSDMAAWAWRSRQDTP